MFDIIFCNIILHIFILLIISFLNINLLGYFLIILFISLITNISLVLKKLTTTFNIYKILFPIICLSIFFEISYNPRIVKKNSKGIIVIKPPTIRRGIQNNSMKGSRQASRIRNKFTNSQKKILIPKATNKKN